MQAKYKRIMKSIAFGCAWTLGGSIFAVPYLLRGEGLNALFAVMLNWLLWGLLAPAINAYDARLPATRSHWWLWVGGHLVFGAILSGFYVIAAAALEYALGLNKWNPWQAPLSLVDWYVWAVLVYAFIVGALQGIKYYRRHVRDALRIERLERRFAEARLQALRAQLDPHFLFNALNGISADVERDPKTARKMIEHLADLLRLSLKAQAEQTVPVAEELAFLDAYIALQKMRFGERIRFECVTAPEVRPVRIPSLLLQPLVENAVRHGLGGRIAGGWIRVSAAIEDSCAVIRVEDDGSGLAEGWTIERNAGIGLSATRERLMALYPAGTAGLTLYPRPGGGVIAEARMPVGRAGGVDAAA
jgi:signal transduction histidine kinase